MLANTPLAKRLNCIRYRAHHVASPRQTARISAWKSNASRMLALTGARRWLMLAQSPSPIDVPLL
jgi:hypothetical protein